MKITGILCAITCMGMIAAVLLKPQITIKEHRAESFWIVALAGALCILGSRRLPVENLIEGLTADTAVNPLKILALFFSMTFLSIWLDEAGFFRYLAGSVLGYAGASQKQLLIMVYAAVSLLTVFTSNDIVILTFTPFLCYFAKHADISPIPYLVTEFVAANTFSMVLVIGNPTNIYLASAAGIGFLSYAATMLLPAFSAGIVVLLVLLMLFRKELKEPIGQKNNETTTVERPAVIIGLLHLGSATLLLAVSSYVNLPMWKIAAAFAISLLVIESLISLRNRSYRDMLRRSLKRLPWTLIPFVLSMFVLVLALQHCELTDLMRSSLASSHPILVYGTVSLLTANLINNIPMSVLFSVLLETGSTPGAVYAAIIGANLGACLTPIGALAGIMWMSILADLKVTFSFWRFTSYGIRIVIPAAAAAFAMLAVCLRIG